MMPTFLLRLIALPWLLLACSLNVLAQGVGAEDDLTPLRLSYLDAEVSFMRPGAEEWSTARLNTPLAAGDGLYTGRGANLELQFGSRAFIRADENTQLTLINQTPSLLQFQITGGRVSFDLRALPADLDIEIDTPIAVFTLQGPGYYRLDVGDEARFITRRGGLATVTPAGGTAQAIRPSEEVVVQSDARVSSYVAPVADQWDRWNTTRSEDLIDSISARHLPPEVAGADDLDHHGSWRVVPEYGSVWVPDATPHGWAPYSSGSWIWDPYYEWTWIDDAPWGWAPFHYGRWIFLDGYWAWTPGPVIVRRPAYAPALVVFYGVGLDLAVRLRLGLPGVGWVALSWGEPLTPWWGRPGHRGRHTWRGWGGPRLSDPVHSHYRNARVPRAVVFTAHERFGREHIRPSHARIDRIDTLLPVQGEHPIRPDRANRLGAAGKGIQPPKGLLDRPVVATRPRPEARPSTEPRNVERAREVREPRYVPAPKQPWAELPRPEFGTQAGGERERRPAPAKFRATKEAKEVVPDKPAAAPPERREAQRRDGPWQATPHEPKPQAEQRREQLPGKPANQTYRRHEDNRGDKEHREHR